MLKVVVLAFTIGMDNIVNPLAGEPTLAGFDQVNYKGDRGVGNFPSVRANGKHATANTFGTDGSAMSGRRPRLTAPGKNPKNGSPPRFCYSAAGC